MKISVVIPCYRSQSTIEFVVKECIEVLNRAQYDFELILVNDCSPDETYNILVQLAKKYPTVKVVDLARNFGQHGALMAGFKFVEGEVVVCMDDDGQAPVDSLLQMISKLDEGYDLVFADYKNIQQSLKRIIVHKLNLFFVRWFFNLPPGLKMNSFYAARRFLIEEVKCYTNPYPTVGGFLLQTTNKIANVSVVHRPRIRGKSGYTFRKLFSLWINGFISFSVKPLRVASFLGIIFACIGVVYGCSIVIRKYLTPDTMLLGWASLMAAIMFLGGMVMMLLGMIGEYVGRTYISINNIPQFVVREIINVKDDK